MNELSPNEMLGIEFPDSEILEFDFSDMKLSFIADSAYVEGRGLIQKRCHVILQSWRSVIILRYDGKKEFDISQYESGDLGEICECTFLPEVVKLAGFERESGLWQSYEFSNPEVRVFFD